MRGQLDRRRDYGRLFCQPRGAFVFMPVASQAPHAYAVSVEHDDGAGGKIVDQGAEIGQQQRSNFACAALCLPSEEHDRWA